MDRKRDNPWRAREQDESEHRSPMGAKNTEAAHLSTGRLHIHGPEDLRVAAPGKTKEVVVAERTPTPLEREP
jgi:hypothetical protein